MKRKNTRPPVDIVSDYLQRGGRGTSGEIATELGMNKSTVYHWLRRLEGSEEAAIVDRIETYDDIGRFRGVAHVFAAPPTVVEPALSIVQRALKQRRETDAIHTAWWPRSAAATAGVRAC